MDVSTKSISVVLPNYNGKHLMELYIPSVIEALHYSKVDYEFIVIDDCSTDDSIAFISETYPGFISLKNTVNSGFSHTCNQGIKIASKELVFLLNSDVKLTPDYFEKQWSYFEHTDTFGVMGRIMNFDGKKIEDTARYPRYVGSKFKANTFYYSENTSDTIYTTYLSGANALVNRKKLVALNGFNEIYSPFYFEDFDLSIRAWKMGWKSYYEHQSICYHRVSATTKTMDKSDFVKITYYRNSFLFQSIHLAGLKRLSWYIQLFTIDLLIHLIKGHFWVLKSLHLFINKKQEINVSQKAISDLQQQIGTHISLDSILEIIQTSIKNKTIKRL